MKKLRFLRSRFRNTVTLLLVCLLTVVLLAGNLLLPFLLRRANVYIDMTPEGLYTVSSQMKAQLAHLEGKEDGSEKVEVEVVFFAPEDRLLENELLRYVYIMSRKLAAANDSISVRTVDLLKNPTAADEFKTAQGSAVSTYDVVVHSGGRYKILSAESFFGVENNELISFNGEYRLASAILSLTTYADGPAAYFETGHGGDYYIEGDAGSDPTLSSFADLLRGAGLRVGKVNLKEEEIPDDCVLLILCGPTEDFDAGVINDYYSQSPLKRLDKYLAGHKSVMVFRDTYAADGTLAPALPNLEDYLSEWGIGFTSTHVTAPEECLEDVGGGKSGDRLISVYPDADADAPMYAMIKDIASLATPPKTVIAGASGLTKTFVTTPIYFSEGVSRSVCPLFYAGPSAKALNAADEIVLNSEQGLIPLAMMGMQATLDAGEHTYSYVFAAGSTAMISNEYLGDYAFGNADVMASVIRSISRTDVYATGDLAASDPNSLGYGGKWFDETHLSASGKNTVFHSQESWEDYAPLTTASTVVIVAVVFFVPVAVLPALGIVVLRRRKNK